MAAWEEYLNHCMRRIKPSGWKVWAADGGLCIKTAVIPKRFMRHFSWIKAESRPFNHISNPSWWWTEAELLLDLSVFWLLTQVIRNHNEAVCLCCGSLNHWLRGNWFTLTSAPSVQGCGRLAWCDRSLTSASEEQSGDVSAGPRFVMTSQTTRDSIHPSQFQNELHISIKCCEKALPRLPGVGARRNQI